jgi:integrase
MRKSQLANKSPHVASRGRDCLRPDEANTLIEATGKVGRQPLRDQCLLRLIYRHGLRASEARDARWTDFDLTAGSGAPKTFHVRRLKGSVDSVHTLDRDEVLALRRLKADSTSPFVFVSERGGPLSPDMIARIVERAGEAAKLGFLASTDRAVPARAHVRRRRGAGACPAPRSRLRVRPDDLRLQSSSGESIETDRSAISAHQRSCSSVSGGYGFPGCGKVSTREAASPMLNRKLGKNEKYFATCAASAAIR